MWAPLLLFLLQTGLIASSDVEIHALMPNVAPKTPDAYLCHKVKIDGDQPVFITQFEANSTQAIAHHILLFACNDPGTEDTWNCGEMMHDSEDNIYKKGPVCRSRQNIIFAWALDAPKLVLPKGVGFKLGAGTDNTYLVVQVHYANVDKFRAGGTDNSGIILRGQTEPLNKLAGVYLMATGGRIASGKEESFDVACQIEENVQMHPFAYRTHAHKLAIVNSGYLVENKAEKQTWTEIGRRSPQLPQMFFPVTNEVVVKKGDVLAARCFMYNFRDHDVHIGATGEDEMCNFYIMYWVDSDQIMKDNTCYSPGPPYWHFNKFSFNEGIALDKQAIPETINQVPRVQQEELEEMKAAGGMHGMHHGDSSVDSRILNQEHDMNMKEHQGHGKSKNTDKIIQMLLEKYGGSARRARRLDSGESSELERKLDELEAAYLMRKLLNELDLN